MVEFSRNPCPCSAVSNRSALLPKSQTSQVKAHQAKKKSHCGEHTNDSTFPCHQFLLHGLYQVTELLWKHFPPVVVSNSDTCIRLLRVLLIFGYVGPAPFQKRTLTFIDLSEPEGQAREAGLAKEEGPKALPGQQSQAGVTGNTRM